nr:MAG TPA: hypothetical protein [Caudoviricetes sp.]
MRFVYYAMLYFFDKLQVMLLNSLIKNQMAS